MAQPDDAPPPSRPLRALLFMTGAAFAFALMAVAGRELYGRLDTFEIMTFRSAIGLALILGWAAATGGLGRIRARRMGLHAVRNATHFVGQNFWFYAVAVIPFSQMFAVEFSVPVWTALVAPFVLGERLTRARLLAAFVGFAGILLVARPDGEISPGILAALGAALGFTAANVSTKLLTRTETTLSIMVWLTAMQLGFGLVSAFWDGAMRWPAAADWPWVLVVAFSGLFAHVLFTAALGTAPATVVAPLDFVRLPILAAIGMAFYDEPLALLTVAGATVILAANLLNLRAEARGAGRAFAAAAPALEERPNPDRRRR